MIPKETYQLVLKQFKQNHWIGKRILATVSGGIDSMALCYILKNIDVPFAIAHCNFQLRGAASDEDATFVEQWAKAHDIPFHINKFDTPSLLQNGGNLQEICRTLRYDWFEQLRSTLKYDYIATAHHQQDVVETVLMNLIKGTGIAGLHGIAPENGTIIRPLLNVNKSQLLNVLNENNAKWREDSSNAKDDYMRNKIRHQLIPIIQDINPQSVQNIFNTSVRIADIEKFTAQPILKQIQKLTEPKGQDIYIAILKLEQQPGYRMLLWEICKSYGFSSAQMDDIIQLLTAHTGKYIRSNTHRIIKNRKHLIITSNMLQESNHILIDEWADNDKIELAYFRLRKKPIQEIALNKLTSNDCAINPQKLQYPLLLRPYQEGDYFYPLGMGMKKKKISKLLKDLKTPLHEKENIWVLQNGDAKIIWVIGIRMDERFRVQEHTTHNYIISKEDL